MSDKPKIVVYHYEDAEAVYVDGKLTYAHHDATEHVYGLLGVEVIYDSAFMQGQTAWAGVAQTLNEVKAYAKARDEQLNKARGMRDEAQALIAMAEELEKGLK